MQSLKVILSRLGRLIMALIKDLKGSFVGGRVSPTLQNRIDLQKFNTWLKEAKNTKIQPEGGISNRAGTIFVGKAKAETLRLTFNINVSATVTINGISKTGTSVYFDLARGSIYEYTVNSAGYKAEEGTVYLSENKVVSVTLEEDSTPCTLTITCETTGATVKINNVEQLSYTGVVGEEVSWEVSKEGYKTEKGKVILTEDIEIPVTLEEVTTATLTINATPNNADISLVINGETYSSQGQISKVLNTGDSYTYTVSCNNYVQETGSGEIEEDTTINVELQVHIMTINNIASTGLQNNVQELASYKINKTGNYSISIKGEGFNMTVNNNSVKVKGGTAIGTISLTKGATVYFKAIKGGTANYATGGCGIGVWVGSECILAVGGAGIQFGNSGGGYNGGAKGYFSRYNPGIGGQEMQDSSAGYSYNGNTGTNQTPNNGCGEGYSFNSGLYGFQMRSYGGSGYVKSEYSSNFTLTAANNSEKGFVQISFVD